MVNFCTGTGYAKTNEHDARAGPCNFLSDQNYFTLNDMSLVPIVFNNLMSVHRLCLDNNVCIEFDPRGPESWNP